MNTTCPACGTPSGYFPDPRVHLPGSYLGHYHCCACHHDFPLIDILRKADAEDLERILGNRE